MANEEHVAMLKQGVAAWNAWYDENRAIRPNLSGADLSKANLSKANLSGANLSGADLGAANLMGANLSDADLRRANLRGAKLIGAYLLDASLILADLSGADIRGANLSGADLRAAWLSGASLSGADLQGAYLIGAKLIAASLIGANLIEAELSEGADLAGANLSRAKLIEADLSAANLSGARLIDADLCRADLQGAILVGTDFSGADLTGCSIHGVSAWGVKLDRATKQQNLVITPKDEPAITVDNIEVAQFVYLLLHNEKIRDVIDTIGKKGVLLLGRFTEDRMVVLERLREKLRDLGYVPMVFNFDKPETKDFTEAVRLLANLSHFVSSTSLTLGRHRLNCRPLCRTTWSRSLPSSSRGNNRSQCSWTFRTNTTGCSNP
jgi:uncharacterized protein YjbI with pentapeptide repeats